METINKKMMSEHIIITPLQSESGSFDFCLVQTLAHPQGIVKPIADVPAYVDYVLNGLNVVDQ